MPPPVPPSPAATPGAPVHPSALATLKKIPPPVWIIGIGGLGGVAFALFRQNKSAAVAEDAADIAATSDPLADQYDPAAPVAYVDPSPPIVDNSGETVGAIGQTALETVTSVLATLPATLTEVLTTALETRPPANPFILQQPSHAPPPSVPPPAQRPTPANKPALPPGYHRGDTVHDGNVRRRFPGALGWIRIGSGGKGAKHFIDYHVRFHTVLQRWRVLPNRHPMQWRKIWEGQRPRI